MSIQKMYGTSMQQNFFHLDHFGCIGVDLFFVISGFVITLVANKYVGTQQGINFLVKRFYRINPAYYIATLFGLLVYLIRIKLNNQSLVASFKEIGLSLSDSLLILPTSGNMNSFKPLLLVGWTLSFEWLFYILFFFLIAIKLRSKAIMLSGLIGLLVIIGQLLPIHDFRFIFITNPIMLEFILGVLICYIYLHLRQIQTHVGTGLLALGITSYMLMVMFGFKSVSNYLDVLSGDVSVSRFVWWGLPSSFIVAGCIILEKNGLLSKIWGNKFALLCGDASYSIYLVHFSTFYLFKITFQNTGLFQSPDALIWLQIIVAVGLSLVFYKVVEKPLLHYMKDRSLFNIIINKKSELVPTAHESF